MILLRRNREFRSHETSRLEEQLVGARAKKPPSPFFRSLVSAENKFIDKPDSPAGSTKCFRNVCSKVMSILQPIDDGNTGRGVLHLGSTRCWIQSFPATPVHWLKPALDPLLEEMS